MAWFKYRESQDSSIWVRFSIYLLWSLSHSIALESKYGYLSDRSLIDFT